MTTDSIGQHNKYVTVTNDNGDSYKINIGLHRGDIEPEEALFDVRQWIYPIRPDFDMSDLKEWHQKMDEWITAGCVISEVTEEIPAIEAQDAVYEDVEVTPAIEAVDAVMGERAVTETIETGSYVNLAGETITETEEQNVTEEVTETVVERQTGEDGITREVEVERTTQVPVMEAYEVEPAIEAVDAVIEQRLVSEAVEAKDAEQVVVTPETTIEKKTWVDTH